MDNGMQTASRLLVEILFDYFNRRSDRRIGAGRSTNNRRQFLKSQSIDIAKEASRCIMGKGVDWSVDSWWGTFNPDASNNVSR